MDTIFNLDSCSPPMLLQSGSNRPMVNVLSNPDPDPIPDPGPKPDPDPNQVEAAFASMLMYHSERKRAGTLCSMTTFLGVWHQSLGVTSKWLRGRRGLEGAILGCTAPFSPSYRSLGAVEVAT